MARAVDRETLLYKLAVLEFDFLKEDSKLWLAKQGVAVGVPASTWPVTVVTAERRTLTCHNWSALHDTLGFNGVA